MSDKVGFLENLPEELKWVTQWCIAGPDKAPYSVGQNGLFNADVTNPKQWLDFETALEVAQQVNGGIGYVLAENDSYTCIDLDVKDKDNEQDPTKWTSQEQFNRFWAIVQAFDSYTERSRSGKGLHIWVRGNIGKGCRRDGVEVYSKQRFIICTGDVVINKEIRENQKLLEILVAEMSAHESNNTELLIETEETESDETVWERASSAANNDKFIPLVEGRWQDLGYPSQSEADLSLMSMFCFYSKSNEQCRRLFRKSVLGQRDKAVKNDRYLNYTLSRIRSRQAREDLELESSQNLGQELVRQMQAETKEPIEQPTSVKVATMAPLPQVEGNGIAWPPGFAGQIASYIYKSAPRPVKEVAIVAALGLLSGICGKPFSIPGSGLNLYIILVARSAIGKEAMHSGIASLMESLRSRIPQAMNFVDFSDFASGPALTKAVANNPCFVNVAGEWGRKLRRLAREDRNEGPMQQLRTVMTNLYQKSGPASIVGGITYSNKEQNIQSVSGVSYSMIGETTPNTLYESLTESMMDDGFLSRFTIVEYKGDRPPHNYNALKEPDQALADGLAQLSHHALTLLHRNARQEVARSQEAGQILYNFDLECDRNINAIEDEGFRQMWNRAALKVTRISALLAVADNFLHPVIQTHHVTWAIDIIHRDIKMMGKKMMEGDIGVDDNSREKKVLSICKEVLTNGFAPMFNVSRVMTVDAIVPRKVFTVKLGKHPAFSNHRFGSSMAIDHTLKSLVDGGYLVEVPKDKLLTKYAFHGKCYQVINISILQ